METLKTAKAQTEFIAENLSLLAIAPTDSQMKSPDFRASAIAEIQAKLAENSENSDDENPVEEKQPLRKVTLSKMDNVTYETIQVTKSNREIVDVEVAMLPLRKATLQKAFTYTTKEGITKRQESTVKFQFDYGAGVLTCTSAPLTMIFENDYKSNFKEFNKGMQGKLYPFKLDTIEPTKYNNSYEGYIIEGGVEEFVELRDEIETEKFQAHVDTKKAKEKADALTAKLDLIQDPAVRQATALALGAKIADQIANDFADLL